jgi:prepilin-type N-terminal cleavage/methylation domain-containing protein
MALRRAKKGAGPGFTLVELLVVMIIVVIGYAALRPTFGGFVRGAQKRAALRKIVGLLSSARAQAIAKGKLVRVICDPSEQVLWAEVQVDPRVDLHEFESIAILGRREVRLPGHLAVVEIWVAGQPASDLNQAAIYFYPDGHTDGAVLALAADTGSQAVIEVAPTTGKVTIRA